MSNHLPQIIKQLPNPISETLSKNSTSQEIFNIAKVENEKALKKSGYDVDWRYTNDKLKESKKRKRNIIWFNPPFSKLVLRKVAKPFLQLVTKYFPRSHKLHKIFDRNTAACTINQKLSTDIIKTSHLKDWAKHQNAIAENNNNNSNNNSNKQNLQWNETVKLMTKSTNTT